MATAVIKDVNCKTIPLNDVALLHAGIRDEIDGAISEVIRSGQFVGGTALKEFAIKFAEYCGVEHAIPCSNGTEALRLALLGVLGPGDGFAEVITVSHTFAATAEAIVHAGYKPVFVDVDPDTYLMDPSQLEQACNARTVAVVPVHLYGQMVDMRWLHTFATKHGLAVIEDAAQAHGAKYDSVSPGQLADAASFSFFPGKNLGALGDAGAVVCRDDRVAQRIRQLIDHGRTGKFVHDFVGTNARMDTLQAAVLSVKLDYLEMWNQQRRAVAESYSRALSINPTVELPFVAREAEHVYHQYVVQVQDRDAVKASLSEHRIQAGVHYCIPLHEQPAFAHLGYEPRDLPVTHELCKRILSLPIYPGMRDGDVERVAEALVELAAGPANSPG